MKEKGFCYKLADFDLKAAKVLQDLQAQAEFCDVSLGCSDSNGELLKGHMAILASFSTVFKNMFQQMRGEFGTKQSLFLCGVSHQDLAAIMDFIYQGEVAVLEERIDSFLATAGDLNIFGLTNNNRTEREVTRKSSRSSSSMYRSEPKYSVSKSRDPVIFEEEKFDKSYFANLSANLNLMPQNGFDDDYQNGYDDEVFQNVKEEVVLDQLNDYEQENPNDFNDINLAEDDAPPEQVMSSIGSKVKSNGKKSFFAKCKICGKEGRRDKIKVHVKSMHGGSTYEGGKSGTKNGIKIVSKKVPMQLVALPPDFSRTNIKYFDHEGHWDPKWSTQIAKNPLIPLLWIEQKGKGWLEYLQNDSDISLSKLRCRVCYEFGNLTDIGKGTQRGRNSTCPISRGDGEVKSTNDLNRKMLFFHLRSDLHKSTVEALTKKRDEEKNFEDERNFS